MVTTHFFILRAGSFSPPNQVAQAEFRWAGSFSPPTQVAQAEFRWLLAAGCCWLQKILASIFR
jgi:hypothetical protein